MAINTFNVKYQIMLHLYDIIRYKFSFNETLILTETNDVDFIIQLKCDDINVHIERCGSNWKKTMNAIVMQLYNEKLIDDYSYEKLYQFINNSNYNS